MSIALNNRINALEDRIKALEVKAACQPHQEEVKPVEKADSLSLEKLWGEIKTIKMRMARNDGKRTPSGD